LNLSAALAWNWTHPAGLSSVIWGSLIDNEKNLYVCSTNGINKLSPDGQQLWSSMHGGEHCVLHGRALYGMHQMSALMFALDLKTGRQIWTKKVATSTGQNGDMVEAHNGVVIASVGTIQLPGNSGKPGQRVIGVSAENGDHLWDFTPDCGLWNLDAMFPDGETTSFMDLCGGAYRLGLYNGSVLWSHKGAPNSFTDGGAVLDPAGDLYTCSSPENSRGVSGSGVVSKYRMSDGQKLWETLVDSPCVNFPAVTADGSTLVLAPGGLAAAAKTKEVRAWWRADEAQEFYHLQLDLLKEKRQRAYYGLPDLPGAILGIDAGTGKPLWRHDVEPWGGMAFALDEVRGWNFKHFSAIMPHCWPSHWSGALTDARGRIYLGRSTGDLYVYDPKSKAVQTFDIRDGILMGGLTSAPGMLVVSTCSFVYVFKF